MYYIKHKQKILKHIPMKQQNIENNNTKNDTFIDRKSSSLASSRGKPGMVATNEAPHPCKYQSDGG